jgi:deoxyribodipyrimidine photo-lyase
MLGFSVEEGLRSQRNNSSAASGASPEGVFGADGFVGGETAALARLNGWVWERDCLKDYFNTRNGMLGADYSSKFSAWLASGCLSPRLIAAECQRYEAERVANKSTYWLVFELLWRDFMRFYAKKHGNRIFLEWGTVGRQDRQEWVRGDQNGQLQAWVEGRTGVPLVDANMRELAATGFMSNRGRQNVASYLVLDLGIDWRLGAAYFEHALIDHDVTANWGNWVAAAGLTGGRVNKFNIAKQSKDYDRDGRYCRHWLPELAKVPLVKLHAPERMSAAEMQASGCSVGQHYPLPLRSQAQQNNGRGGRGGGGGKGGKGGSQQTYKSGGTGTKSSMYSDKSKTKTDRKAKAGRKRVQNNY